MQCRSPLVPISMTQDMALSQGSARNFAPLGTRLEQVLEAAPNGVVVVDARGTIALVNPELERMFGYARASLLGQSVDVLLPERFRAGHATLRAAYTRDP